MFDYLQKYNNLPKEIRDKVSTPNIMSVIEGLEQKYGFNLATIVMKVVIKDIDIKNLEKHFIVEYNLDESKSKDLSEELKTKVFVNIADYLNTEQELTSFPITPIKQVANKQKLEGETPKEKPASSVSSANSSNFFFSPEDEKEIQELAKNVGGYIQDPSFNNNVEKKIDDIINKTQINFGSDLLLIRFKDILKTYLRGIRDRIETKQTLTKAIVSGGLGFDIESSENVLKITDSNTGEGKKELKIKPFPKISVPEDKEDLPPQAVESQKKLEHLSSKKIKSLKDVGVRDIDYDLSSLEKKKKETSGLDTGHELAPPPPKLLRPSPPPSTSVESSKLTKTKLVPLRNESEVKFEKPDIKHEKFQKPEKKKIFSKFSYGFKNKKDEDDKTRNVDKKGKNMVDARPISKIGGKIKMEDVKFEPKTMGPIDELRHMNLMNFRRFNKDPFKAADKILEKINLFEDEYSKKLESIKAWRLSPLNKLYLKIGEESISKRKSIDAIIEERKATGDDYLNDQEISAIIGLNKELRF